MVTRDLTLGEVDRLEAAVDADVAFEMDEEAFRAFYDRTARSLWGYLSRLTGNPQAADDLLQETYYRFLRSRVGWQNEAHRRAYLFRIATNLVKDGRRRDRHGRTVPLPDSDHAELVAGGGNVADAAVRTTDLGRALAQLRPRERAMLWLAYAQGEAHAEIADVLGVKTGSMKILLSRARKKLAALMRRSPHAPSEENRRDDR